MAGAPGIVIDGKTIRRPGVYGRVRGDGLARSARPPQGVIAVLGIFERGTPLVPTAYTNQDALREALPTLGGRIARLLWQASNDSKIKGSPSTVYLVRVNPALKASSTLVDANAANCLVISAKDYGVYGNAISRLVESGTTTGKKFTFQEGAKPAVVVDNVALTAFTLNHLDTTELAALTVSVDPTAATGYVRVAFTSVAISLSTDPKTFSPTKIAFDGPLTVTLNATSGAATSILITGTNKETASPDTETLAIGGAATTITSTKSWSAITAVTLTTKGTATSMTLSGRSFDMPVTTYPKLADVVARIQSAAALGYTCVQVSGANLAITNLDTATTVSAHNASTASIKADLYECVRRINAEGIYVTAARSVGGTALPPANVAKSYLGGGSEGSTSNSDWTAALTALRTVRVDLVVPLTTSSSIHALVKAHTVYMEGNGRDERTAFLGPAADETLSALGTRAIALNDRNLSLCPPEIQVYDDAGVAEWLTPEWFALLMAGLTASARMGVPLTDKIVNVLDFRNNSTWDSVVDAEAVIEVGLLTLYRDTSGFIRVMKQLTTYLQAEHPVYSLVSVNRTANNAAKRVRAKLAIYVGEPGTDVSADFLERKTAEELDAIVADKEAESYDPESISFTDINNGFKGSFAVRAVDSTEFILANCDLLPLEG